MNRALLLAAILLAAGAAVLWRFYPATTNVPDGSGNALASVEVPPLSGTALAGEAAFNENCAICHGENAAGRESAGPPLVHKIYEPGHHGDDAFRIAARNGVRAHHWQFGDMMPVENVSDTEIEQIIVYVRELQRANGIQ